MTYMAGYYNLLLLPFTLGASVVVDRAFDARSLLSFWKTVGEHRADVLWLVPTIMAMLLKIDRGDEGRTLVAEQINMVVCGTAPLSPELRAQFEERYGIAVHDSYGLSETLFAAVSTPARPAAAGAVGTVLDGVEMTVRPIDGAQDGELLIRSPDTMVGYLDEGTEFTDPSEDGWLPTGDLGTIGPDGEVRISGRSKEIVIRGGVNVSPVAVEGVLAGEETVERVAVVGVPDAVLGEQLVAVVQMRDGATLEEAEPALKARAAEALPSSQHPGVYLQIDELPRTPTGKVRKAAVRDMVIDQLGLPAAGKGFTVDNGGAPAAGTSRLIDLSHPLHEGMLTFPNLNHPRTEVTQLARHRVEGRATRRLVLGTHTGTHLDAPLHFIEDGGSIDQVPLSTLVGPAVVADLGPAGPLEEISLARLQAAVGGGLRHPRLLLRFGWSARFGRMDFYTESPFLARDACTWLVEQGAALVGMDIPSPDDPRLGFGSEEDSPNHHILLGAGVILLEYLNNLEQLSGPEVFLAALPLRGARRRRRAGPRDRDRGRRSAGVSGALTTLPETLLLVHAPGEILAGNPLLRTWALGDAAFVELLAALRGGDSDALRGAVRGLRRSSCATRARRRLPTACSATRRGWIAQRRWRAWSRSTWRPRWRSRVDLPSPLRTRRPTRRRLGAREHALDRAHHGNVHQRVGEYVARTLRRRDLDGWWADQKFTPDHRAPREGPYRWVQWEFMAARFPAGSTGRPARPGLRLRPGSVRPALRPRGSTGHRDRHQHPALGDAGAAGRRGRRGRPHRHLPADPPRRGRAGLAGRRAVRLHLPQRRADVLLPQLRPVSRAGPRRAAHDPRQPARPRRPHRHPGAQRRLLAAAVARLAAAPADRPERVPPPLARRDADAGGAVARSRGRGAGDRDGARAGPRRRRATGPRGRLRRRVPVVVVLRAARVILGAVQVVVNVADLAVAEAPLTAAGFTRSFHEPRLASHPAKDIMLSGPRDALAMVHLTPPARRTARSSSSTAYAGGAPAGAAAFTMDNSQRDHDHHPRPRRLRRLLGRAQRAGRATTACAASAPRCPHGG